MGKYLSICQISGHLSPFCTGCPKTHESKPNINPTLHVLVWSNLFYIRPGRRVIDVELQFEITSEIYGVNMEMVWTQNGISCHNGILLGQNLKSKEILNRNTYRFTWLIKIKDCKSTIRITKFFVGFLLTDVVTIL